MAETIVQFITNLITGLDSQNNPIVQSSSSARVFDFEISPIAQKYYLDRIQELQELLYDDIIDQQFTSQTQIIDYLKSKSSQIIKDGDTITSVQTTKFEQIVNIIQDLVGWSYSKHINSSTGAQANGTYTPKIYSNTNGTVSGYDVAGEGLGDGTGPFTMDRYMAEGLSRLINTLRAAGWDPSAQLNFTIDLDNPSPEANRILELAAKAILNVTQSSTSNIYNIQDIFVTAQSAALQARIIGDATTGSDSIQQLLMVDYVSRGNDLLFEEMSKLKTRIDANQQALSFLNSLQDLMNMKDPQKFVLQLGQLGSLLSPNYSQYEEATFSGALGVVEKFSSDAALKEYFGKLFNPNINLDQLPGGNAGGIINQIPPGSAFEAFYQYSLDETGPEDKIQLGYDITALLSGQAVQRIRANLQVFISAFTPSPDSGQQPPSIVEALKKILNDFPVPDANGNVSDPLSIVKWVRDNTVAGKEGDNQRHLNEAITAAQSYNDTQREELRRVMFVFEEFYKSAAGLLSRITQLLEKMAGFISR